MLNMTENRREPTLQVSLRQFARRNVWLETHGLDEDDEGVDTIGVAQVGARLPVRLLPAQFPVRWCTWTLVWPRTFARWNAIVSVLCSWSSGQMKYILNVKSCLNSVFLIYYVPKYRCEAVSKITWMSAFHQLKNRHPQKYIKLKLKNKLVLLI